MSSSPRYAGPRLASDSVVLRGADAATLLPAVVAGNARPPSVTAAAARDAARADGYAEGWAQGSKAARATLTAQAQQAAERRKREDDRHAADVQSAVSAMLRAADDLERRELPLAQEMEHALVSAAFTMAEAILGRELAVTSDPGRDAVVRALSLAPHGQPVRVRLHPADAAILDSADLSSATGRDVELVADPAVGRGDAIAHCGATRIDAGLAAATQRVRRVLGL